MLSYPFILTCIKRTTNSGYHCSARLDWKNIYPCINLASQKHGSGHWFPKAVKGRYEHVLNLIGSNSDAVSNQNIIDSLKVCH